MDAQHLAKEVMALIQKYCILPDEDAYVAVVVWVFHTHVVGAFESTPRLSLTSPEKQCGKTRVLEVLALLCKDAKNTVNISVAALYRLIDQQQPTLLMDEVDAVFNPKKPSEKSEDLRAIINSGYRKNNPVIRCGNFGRDIEEYEAFSAMALASINSLPDTVMNRSVQILMRRRRPSEKVSPFRERTARDETEPIYQALSDWGSGAADELHRIIDSIDLPDGLEDRPADIWEPLIAVADCIGGDWPQRARTAAVNMTNAQQSGDGSIGVQLLKGIKQCFETGEGILVPYEIKNSDGKKVTKRLSMVDGEKVTSACLVQYLNTIEGSPWTKWNRDEGINANDVARYLGNYGVAPKQVKVHKTNLRGYSAEQFEDAWSRYCKDDIAWESVTPGVYSGFDELREAG